MSCVFNWLYAIAGFFVALFEPLIGPQEVTPSEPITPPAVVQEECGGIPEGAVITPYNLKGEEVKSNQPELAATGPGGAVITPYYLD